MFLNRQIPGEGFQLTSPYSVPVLITFKNFFSKVHFVILAENWGFQMLYEYNFVFLFPYVLLSLLFN